MASWLHRNTTISTHRRGIITIRVRCFAERQKQMACLVPQLWCKHSIGTLGSYHTPLSPWPLLGDGQPFQPSSPLGNFPSHSSDFSPFVGWSLSAQHQECPPALMVFSWGLVNLCCSQPSTSVCACLTSNLCRQVCVMLFLKPSLCRVS